MKNNNQKLGSLAYNKGVSAEKLAETYLMDNQWNILHKRFRCPVGEIDLIATKKNWLLFIEVKSRKKINDALLAITMQQKRRLLSSAYYYLEFYQLHIENVRFDLIAIDQQGQIEHLKNIILDDF